MIFAGVGKDDLRVKAAKKWLEKNYSVKENLPMGKSGLFYYYHTMAKCLDARDKTPSTTKRSPPQLAKETGRQFAQRKSRTARG